jgi:4'-phosphopantetheinyl transferase
LEIVRRAPSLTYSGAAFFDGLVTVYRARVREALGWAATLSDDEIARASRFRFDEDRNRFVAARGALRSIVGPLADVHPASLVFTVGEYGKLRVEGGPAFNVSHSGDWILIAVGEVAEVGVDVERARSDIDVSLVVKTVFGAREQLELGALPAEQRTGAFYRTWARKEAVLKAWGTGFSLDAREVDFGIDPAMPCSIADRRGSFGEAQVADVEVDGEHAGAVAMVRS